VQGKPVVVSFSMFLVNISGNKCSIPEVAAQAGSHCTYLFVKVQRPVKLAEK
jgi:hypothetical protein